MAIVLIWPLASLSGSVAAEASPRLGCDDYGPGGVVVPRPDHEHAAGRIRFMRARVVEEWLLRELDEIERLLRLRD